MEEHEDDELLDLYEEGEICPCCDQYTLRCECYDEDLEEEDEEWPLTS